MRGKSLQEVQVLKRAKKLENRSDWLGPGSMMTQQSHVNASRAIMENHQIGHAVNVTDAEPPLVPTGFEAVLGSKSAMLQRSDADYVVVHKLVKNDYNYVIIGYDEKHRRYHAWKREELEEHSEGFATKYKNKFMDSLEPGDVIEKGTMIKTSESFDKYGNYSLGRNLNTVYMISLMVMEDGIACMNGADEKMKTARCSTVSVPMNDNEIMVNLYGDDDRYQGFPEVGEKIRNGVLCATRAIDHAKAPFSLKSKQLRNIESGDRPYYENGRIIDITIRYNKDIRDLTETPINHRLLEYYRSQQEYFLNLYNIMDEIVRNADDEGYTFSDEFSRICEEAHAFVDSSAFFVDRNESVFGNMYIEFKVMSEEPLMIGSKLVGRFGNKGVISTIIPPEKSYYTEDGRPIEVIVAALGMVGRLNPGQTNEHDINDLGYRAVLDMKETKDLNKKGKILCKLLKYLNSDEADEFKSYYKNLSDKEKAKFCKTVETNGIYIVQDPIDNASIMDMAKAHEEFPPVWTRIVFPDGSKSLRKVICSKMYFYRLKQDPREKYSARSRGPINPLYDLPSKSNNKKNHREPFADVAVRIGSQEIEVLLAMCPISEVIADFMAESSTSTALKEKMSRAYYEDIEDPDDEDYGALVSEFNLLDSIAEDVPNRKNREILDAYSGMLGTRLEIEYEYPDDDSNAMFLGPHEDFMREWEAEEDEEEEDD